MRFIRSKSLIVGLGLALSLVACGDDGGDGGGGGAEVADSPEFESGTTMAEIGDLCTPTSPYPALFPPVSTPGQTITPVARNRAASSRRRAACRAGSPGRDGATRPSAHA